MRIGFWASAGESAKIFRMKDAAIEEHHNLPARCISHPLSRGPDAAVRESELAPSTITGGRVSGKVLLCQPEVGYQAEIDIFENYSEVATPVRPLLVGKTVVLRKLRDATCVT